MFRQILAALATVFRHTPAATPIRDDVPYLPIVPPMWRHGGTKHRDGWESHRRWRKVRMRMQRASRQRNRV